MRHTLDDLLDATGLGELGERDVEKTANQRTSEEPEYLLKLADRCERAAAQPSSEPGTMDRALAEKTAAIAVIAETLAEIDAIADGASEKIASEDGRAAAFIEQALASGHDPEAIAAFMKKAGFFSRAAHSLVGRGHVGAGEALKGVGGGFSEKGVRHFGAALRDAAQNMSPAGANRYVERLRASYGDNAVRHILETSGARLNHVPSVRDLLPKRPEPGKNLLSVNLGGKERGLTSDQLAAAAKPAAAVAGGVVAGKAMFGRGDKDEQKKKHGNVTIISP